MCKTTNFTYDCGHSEGGREVCGKRHAVENETATADGQTEEKDAWGDCHRCSYRDEDLRRHDKEAGYGDSATQHLAPAERDFCGKERLAPGRYLSLRKAIFDAADGRGGKIEVGEEDEVLRQRVCGLMRTMGWLEEND